MKLEPAPDPGLTPRTCWWAIISLIYGSLAFFLPSLLISDSLSYWCLYHLSTPLLTALHILPFLSTVILAHVAIFKINHSKNMLTGRKCAQLGLIVGYLPLLLVLISVPSFTRARLRGTATTVLSSNLRMTDAAKDQWQLENNKTPADAAPRWCDLTPYMKAGSELALGGGNDTLGNPIFVGRVGEEVRVNPRTKQILQKAIGGDTFWGPYS